MVGAAVAEKEVPTHGRTVPRAGERTLAWRHVIRQDADVTAPVTVVVGVDGAGRTYRLDQLAAAATVPVVRVDPPLATIVPLVEQARAQGALVLVDDPHRLDTAALSTLAEAARGGVAMVLARRPTIDSPALAELDEALSGRGRVEQLAPLTIQSIVDVLNGQSDAQALLERSGGLPAIAVLAAAGTAPSAALVARVQRRLALLGPGPAGLARLLALRLDLGDAVLSSASTLDSAAFVAAMRSLRDQGLLVPGGERMIPAVAEAIQAELSPAERRRVHDAAAQALLAQGGDVATAAAALRAARVFTPAAVPAYVAMGERLRFDDPAAALGWFDDAVEAGAVPTQTVAGRAEAVALLGLPSGPADEPPADPPVRARLLLVDGAVSAHEGRAQRSAQTLADAPPPGPILAVPQQVATGRITTRGEVAGQVRYGTSEALERFAEASVAAVDDPAGAVPLLIEAAETVEQARPPVVLPDTPHAVGALVAAVAGDAGTAQHLLERALASGVGGPVAQPRHRLLLAWIRLRSGRYDTAVAELARLGDAATLRGRERFLAAALSAALARRSGDVARLRDAWATVEPALARRTVDLFTAEAVEELVVAATRLRHQVKVEPVLAALDGIVAGLGAPPAWAVTVGWARLQVAVAEEDAAAAAQAAAALPAGGGARQQAQREAASRWAAVLAGEVDEAAVVAAADALAVAELPWEGSRLAGQAAIRTSDAGVARRLLERARELSSAEIMPPARAEIVHSGLSEREVEVARMVLAGDTYREIGGRLFISPKTVEHHVARIRTKLGATSRAEFVAALRTVLPEG
jgi:DNA-binding CsgD family transcriptional regulator